MLYITSTPKDFTPIYKGLIFSVESDEIADLEVKILNAESEEVVGTKRFTEVTEAVIDIAPYIARYAAMREPIVGSSRLEELPSDSYYIIVTDGQNSETSESIIVSSNLDTPQQGVNTVMPLPRNIAYGEQDDVRLQAPTLSTVVAEAVSDRGESLTLELLSGSGAVVLHLSTEDFNPLTKSITVTIYFNDILNRSFTYNIIPQYGGSQRVAWVSQSGTIERYTFPVIDSQELTVTRHAVSDSQSRKQIVRYSTRRTYTLNSECENNETIESLSAIIAAEKVWFENGGELTEVEVEQSSVVTHNFGKVGSVSLTFAEQREEVVL